MSAWAVDDPIKQGREAISDHDPKVDLDALVRLAASSEIRRRVLEVFEEIEADSYLEDSKQSLRVGLSIQRPFWDMCTALAAYVESYRPEAYLEIGVRQGRSAAVVAAFKPDIDLYLFDMWHPDYAGVPNPGPEFVRSQLERVKHHGAVRFVNGRSQETIPEYFSNPAHPSSIPLITVDGDHRDAGARADLENVVEHLPIGGMLAFDDIVHPTYPTLCRTWQSFLAEHPELDHRENLVDGTGTAIAIRTR
jgi:predicted O-methyltransferase YrrM